ncbi:hypothetical protein EZI54_06765 [Marinobacter halodurans]|uniref:Thioredoxin-like fold domain-containing protein n=1 Tax=Marinobacter halodurans TaxID=2528979 RepID=A0ABY1ZQ18_9GAMM|nr:hypothetical protein [Marinobacter halodurans]TBW57352.1 hypothetical protein EZI54_06765 [Marinobacter halodurans]
MAESNLKSFFFRELPIAIVTSAVLLGGYFYFVHDSGRHEGSRTTDASTSKVNYSPNDAAAIVSKRLPQVAVVGTKAGPDNSVEVFIQVPGVLNMQSVYVLSDNKTVISGFILPQMDGGAIPGGQMTIPDGRPTVNPNTPRPKRDQIQELLQGHMPETGNERRVTGAASTQVSVPKPHVSKPPKPRMPQPSKAPNNEVPTPDLPASALQVKGSDDNSGATHTGASGGISPQQADASTSTAVSKELVDRDRFKELVQDSLDNGAVIAKIRNSGSEAAQQQSYLKAVKATPSIKQGHGARELYVFFDPNCPVCHKLYRQLANQVKNGELTLHWIPAVVFSDQPSSMAASALMLSAIDQGNDDAALDMLRQVMTMPGGASELYSSSYSADNDKPFIKAAASNTALMTAAQPATPLLVYKNHQGNLELDAGIPSAGFVNRISAD